MMDWMMPLMSVWISFSVSSAIAVYWMFQNVLGAVQQMLLYKLYPVPVVTDEQIKQAELELKSKAKAIKPKSYEIDDYDKTPADEKVAPKAAKKKAPSKKNVKISPKFKESLKQNSKAPKAKKKI